MTRQVSVSIYEHTQLFFDNAEHIIGERKRTWCTSNNCRERQNCLDTGEPDNKKPRVCQKHGELSQLTKQLLVNEHHSDLNSSNGKMYTHYASSLQDNHDGTFLNAYAHGYL